jgi:TorA maturation chaperone TorD
MKETVQSRSRSAWHGPHAKIRTDAYVLLAALLIGTPSEDLIEIIRNLHWDEDIPEKLRQALASINKAGRTCSCESIAAEFQKLFVGLGSGEMVPYGSWYREKMIQSAPLAAIRTDIGRLGIIRRSDTFESEDHAGALCEIMALLSNPENGIPENEQAAFFENHINPWMSIFFKDLQQTENAQFYSAVGNFGHCFLEGESEFLRRDDGV